MRNKFTAVVLASAIAGQASLAFAATAEFTLDWTQSALSMNSGIGSLVNINDGAMIDTQISTDSELRFDGGYGYLSSSLGSNKASGNYGSAKVLAMENGHSTVNVGNGAAVILDLQANAKGVFKVPYSYALSTTNNGDVGATISYSFQTVNYQIDGSDSVPVLTFSGSFIAGANEAKTGQGFVEISLDNTTDKVLRFQLVQSTSAFASVSGVSAVPEASQLVMILSGMVVLLGRVRRRMGGCAII